MKRPALSQSNLRYIAKLVLVTVLYFYSGKLGLSLAFIQTNASAVWPCTGIALTAYLLLGYRIWPAIFVGAFFVNLTTAGTVATSIGIAAGNTLEGFVGAYLVNRFAGGRRAFDSPSNVLRFVFFAGIVSTTISATFGVTTLVFGGFATRSLYGPIWFTWWLGDMVSNFVVAPVLLIWSRKPSRIPEFKRLLEAAILLLATFFISMVIFGGWILQPTKRYPVGFLCLPFVLWSAFRLGMRGSVITLFMISAVSIWGTLHGLGPFAMPDSNDSLLLLQTFTGIMTVTNLIVASVIAEHKRTMKAVQDLSSRKSAVLDASLDSIISMDSEGKIVDFNAAAERTFGYSYQQVAGKELATAIIPPALRKQHRLGLAHYLKTGEGPVFGKRLEFMAMRSDGSEFPVEMAINVVRLDHKPMFTGFLHDITEFKQSKERFQLVVENAPTGMVMINQQGKIILVNQEIEKKFGYKREELIDQPIEILVPERFRKTHITDRADFFAQPSFRAMGKGRDLYGLRKDKSEFPVEIGLNPIQTIEGMVVMASIIDITERKKAAEDRLLLANIVESSDDAIITKTLDGIITSWNKGAERLYGYTAEEIIGRSISVLVPADKSDELAEIFRRLKEGESTRSHETVRIRKDRKMIYISATISPIKSPWGKSSVASTIARDITAQKLAEDALIIANKRLEELVELKDEFVANVSHELRTPLTAIKEGISLISDRVVGPLNDEQEDFLKTIEQSVERLAELISNLLDLSKIEAGKFRLSPQCVQLSPIIETLIGTYKTIAGNRTIRLNVDDVPDVFADPDRLLQILGNLFANAVKFTNDDGIITISAHKQAGVVLVSIEDNGIGIAREDLPKLFNKFSQVGKKKAQGTGLGLAIVKQLVERHQGSIFVVSTPGKGSRFTFTLPIYVPHISGPGALDVSKEGTIDG